MDSVSSSKVKTRATLRRSLVVLTGMLLVVNLLSSEAFAQRDVNGERSSIASVIFSSR